MDKFIQQKGYIKEDKDGNKNFEFYNLDEIDEEKTYNVLLFSPDENRSIELVRCLLNLTAEVLNSRSVTTKEYAGLISDEGISINIVHIYKALSSFLGYFNNCSSIRDNGSIADFDKEELLKRLENVKRFIK